MPGKMFDWIMNQIYLPSESIPGETLIELIGCRRVLIEKHLGVTCYSRENITIKTTFGKLCVSGCDLHLDCMSKEQLIINGNITGISLNRREA